jgi:hypothetical protein
MTKRRKFYCRASLICKQLIINGRRETGIYSGSTMTYSNLNKSVKMETTLNINYTHSVSIPALDTGEKFIRI